MSKEKKEPEWKYISLYGNPASGLYIGRDIQGNEFACIYALLATGEYKWMKAIDTSYFSPVAYKSLVPVI